MTYDSRRTSVYIVCNDLSGAIIIIIIIIIIITIIIIIPSTARIAEEPDYSQGASCGYDGIREPS